MICLTGRVHIDILASVDDSLYQTGQAVVLAASSLLKKDVMGYSG